ncbi:low temperature requirement protein A [Streptomyces sp. HNM0574]|nr:low temperature requirement protein A [Streptomyces sp. HNM0574]NLU68086.1 low temperature requirement protein A [Streptomyces sp. HNM0574]
MRARRVDEPHRAATPLELLFDLCFVVAVAQAGAGLEHDLAAGHFAHGVLSYVPAFFAVWWAWMNFTWFASAYDTDDVPYRVATFVQISGSLIIAAGLPTAFREHDFRIVVVGYTVLRVALVAQWLRAARAHPEGRRTALTYAAGVGLLALCWLATLTLREGGELPVFYVLAAGELLVPVIAEHRRRTPWHPHHIAERYGLFTIIVLGESVAAATVATEEAISSAAVLRELAPTLVGGLLLVFGLWWLYFGVPAGNALNSVRRALVWGYGHYAVLASAAALGAGLATVAEHLAARALHPGEHPHLTDTQAFATVTVPTAVFLLTLWLLHLRPHTGTPLRGAVFPLSALLVLATTFTPEPLLLTGILTTLTVITAHLLHGIDTERGEDVPG